ncbi:endonuclease V-domain-containing protein [Chytridium lagenaria]|nr:endonuclease V-domain-containing protein [Chytridium lagenaria]
MEEEAKRMEWISIQDELRDRVVFTDDLDFGVPDEVSGKWEGLNLIAGMDVSFVEGTMKAVGCLSILSFPELTLIHQECEEVVLEEPYIPGFLAFRELKVLLRLLELLDSSRPDLKPQVLFIDGNGALHPRRFGLGCHVGLVSGIPAIGIGKNFLTIADDGLNMDGVKLESKNKLTGARSWFPLVGKSGFVYGAAVRTTKDSANPIFVSQGHRISVETAVKLTFAVSKFRTPEPIRSADFISREYIRRGVGACQKG